MKEMKDEELMVRYQKYADPNAFNELFRRYKGKIYGYLRSRVTDGGACDDIFQTTFLKMHQKKQKYSDKYPFSVWIFTICRNNMLDYFRKKRPDVDINNPKVNMAVEESEPEVESKIPEYAWQALPESQKVAIQMRYQSDQPFDEIARELKTSSQNVRKLISRGIQKLRFLLKGDSLGGKQSK